MNWEQPDDKWDRLEQQARNILRAIEDGEDSGLPDEDKLTDADFFSTVDEG